MSELNLYPKKGIYKKSVKIMLNVSDKKICTKKDINVENICFRPTQCGVDLSIWNCNISILLTESIKVL